MGLVLMLGSAVSGRVVHHGVEGGGSNSISGGSGSLHVLIHVYLLLASSPGPILILKLARQKTNFNIKTRLTSYVLHSSPLAFCGSVVSTGTLPPTWGHVFL